MLQDADNREFYSGGRTRRANMLRSGDMLFSADRELLSAPDARANDPDARADERSDQTADHCYCTVLCMRLVAWRLAALVGHL